MDFKCTNCGALLSPPPSFGAVITCHYCGAAQQPAVAPPMAPPVQPDVVAPAPRPVVFRRVPVPVPAPAFDVEPIRIPPPTGARIAALVIVALIAAVGIGIAVAVSNATASKQAAALSGALSIDSLKTLSLAQTPEAMAKVTGVKAERANYGDIVMDVPLKGSSWERLQVNWDPAEPTHAKSAALYGSAPAPDDAAIRHRLETVFGRRIDKGNVYFQGAGFNYTPDNARAAGEPKEGPADNPHWKDKGDAMWDALRFAVLGQNVRISDEESRDWLGRGYPLSAITAVDLTVDVDHSAAVMQAAFPGVHTTESIGLRHTIAIDHPWYGEAELTWANAKGGTLTEVYVRAPPQAAGGKFANQADIEACVQAAFGPPTRRYEEDHLKATYDTDWVLAGGGDIRVYGHMVDITVAIEHPPLKMPAATFKKAIGVLDTCGRHKG